MAMPRPVPLALVVKNGSKILGRCSGGMPGPLSRTAMRIAGWPSSSGLLGPDLDGDRGRAGRQGVVQDVAEDLLEAERVRDAAQVDARRSPRRSTACLPLAGRFQVAPGLAPDRAQVARGLVELDRGGVAADVLVEGMEVVLGLLDAADQVERLGPVADGQGEHLQAGLAALQRVAALVRQPGDHLADGGQPLGLQGPLLGLLEERDVLADLEDRGPVLVVGEVARVPDHRAPRAVAAGDRVLEAAGGAARR